MRIVYMGTPELSAEVFRAILATEHEVVAAVTQPDRPKGRKGELAQSPVKELALEHGITVLQPEKARQEDFLRKIEELAPELIVVAAFGQILPERLLNIPKLGCINVHTSLLPKYRGASPIQWAVINGDEKTGVTIMYMAKGIDTGDIIAQREVELAPKETAQTLHDKLAKAGGELVVQVIESLGNGTATRTPQDESKACYVTVLDKSLGEINFSEPAVVIERLIRGLDPWPSAYTFVLGKTLKIWSADALGNDEAASSNYSNRREKAPCGTVVGIGNDFIDIRTGDGILRVYELQLEGKKRMKTGDFLRGFSMKEGDYLGR